MVPTPAGAIRRGDRTRLTAPRTWPALLAGKGSLRDIRSLFFLAAALLAACSGAQTTPPRTAAPTCPPPAWATEAPGSGFDEHFQDSTLRVDLLHRGTATGEALEVKRAVLEGPWAGPRTWLIDPTGYGKYQARILDAATGKLLWSRGYATLFGEWQTTGEAKKTEKAFEETVRFPLPKQPCRLEIHSRNRKGAFEKVFSHDWGSLEFETAPSRTRGPEVLVLHQGAAPARALDVVILPDGYTRREAAKLRRDLDRYARVFLSTPPFDRNRDRVSLRAVLAFSGTSGPSEPRKGYTSDNAVGTTFDTFGSPRYLTTSAHHKMRDLAGRAPYDAVVVLVNTSRYGGAGIFNFFAISISDNEYDEYVVMHEFGHSFGGLGDEYYSSSVAYSDFYPRGVEPWEPNITALLGGRKSVKWRRQIASDTPVPTPPTDENSDRVGVFEGAGYSAKGLYRPARDCKMFSKRRIDYCPVCACAMEAMLRLYSE